MTADLVITEDMLAQMAKRTSAWKTRLKIYLHNYRLRLTQELPQH